MTELNVAVIYYSSTGTNYQMAQTMAEAARAEGAEVRVRKVRELAPAAAIDSNPAWRAHLDATQDVPEAALTDLEWADVYIFNVPTRFGTMPAQIKQFLDTTGPLWSQGKLVNKIVTATSSASNPHGGQEATLLALYNTFYHWGSLIVAPGYTDPVLAEAGGNPYGTSVTAKPEQGVPEAAQAAAQHQTRRALQIARWLKAGQAAR